MLTPEALVVLNDLGDVLREGLNVTFADAGLPMRWSGSVR